MVYKGEDVAVHGGEHGQKAHKKMLHVDGGKKFQRGLPVATKKVHVF